jgi:hypothetical protein
MPCRTVQTSQGIAIVCSRGSGPAPTRCVCHRSARWATLKLCDFPLTGAKTGQTCDRVVCTVHALHLEPATDYCPAHARLLEGASLR